MASEIRISLNLSVTNPNTATGYKRTISKNLTLNQTGIGAWDNIVIVGTAEENLAPTDITTLGWMYLENLDSTNYVDYGISDGGAIKALGKIKAGEIALLRLKTGVTVRAQANTAPVKLQVIIWED